tara:strand:+ start:101394 stop:103244 length:1851 start_codon:yes stop_codon:yes gene_type:complete
MKRASKQPSVPPAQLARVRTQLNEIIKQLQSKQTQSSNPKAALAQITQLIKKHPALPEVNHVAAMCSSRAGDPDRALYFAQRAASLEPTNAAYQQTYGSLLVQSGKYHDAIEPLETARTNNSEDRALESVLAVAYYQTGRIAEAKELLLRAIDHPPSSDEASMNLALLESDTAHADRAIELMQAAIERSPNNPILRDSLCMFACYADTLTPSKVFAIHQAFGQSIEQLVPTTKAYKNTPDPTRRLRIGFVSPDFRQHSNTYFLEPILEHLDRERFEVCIYSTSSATDQVTKRLKAHADLWRDCRSGIMQTAKQITQDRIDILVELTGHFASNKLPLFAVKPAPVSLTAIGYANTTGLSNITARLVDAITDPEPTADALSTEQLVRVPDCFLCYRPPEDLPDPQTDPSRPFTFGSLNDLRKVAPSTLRTWATILTNTPDTRLLLKASRFAQSQVRDDLLARFADLGITSDRITLLARTDTIADHLKVYNTIDCALDTFPYTGTTTTCEALAMGVPVLTLLGNAHAGRVSASLLKAIGRDDLIADNLQSYIDKAAALASAGPVSTEDRIQLRNQLLASPLTDEPTYVRKVETILTDLWSAWCAAQERATQEQSSQEHK